MNIFTWFKRLLRKQPKIEIISVEDIRPKRKIVILADGSSEEEVS